MISSTALGLKVMPQKPVLAQEGSKTPPLVGPMLGSPSGASIDGFRPLSKKGQTITVSVEQFGLMYPGSVVRHLVWTKGWFKNREYAVCALYVTNKR